MAKSVTFFSILAALVGKWILDEMKAWLPWCARRLFDLSVRLLPVSQQERYDEEWRSHIESYPGPSLTSAHFVWAALNIRVQVATDAFCERWIRQRAQILLFSVVLYYWLRFQLSRIFTAKKIGYNGSSAQNLDLLTSAFLIVIALVLLKEHSKTTPIPTGALA